ncbi:MAG: hypothetical protein ACK5C3_03220 [bacterium]
MAVLYSLVAVVGSPTPRPPGRHLGSTGEPSLVIRDRQRTPTLAIAAEGPALGIRDMSRNSATVILLERDRFTMSDSWTDRIELTRSAGCKFEITGSKDLGAPTLEQPGNLPITHVDGITSPRALYRALNDAALMLDVELEWVDAIPLIAKLDWITAAVIAKDAGHEVPELPSFETLVSQRSLMSLRRMGKVTIGAEWGNEMHELMMSFEQWLRILGGEDDLVERPYRYEGKRFMGVWSFDGNGRLEVGYDDGGQGWEGLLQDLELIDGPKLEDADLAKLAVHASGAA